MTQSSENTDFNRSTATTAEGLHWSTHVHPQLRPYLDPLARMLGSEPLNSATLAAWRKLDFSRPPLPNPGWQERTIAGLPGSPDVRIYIVNANPSTAPRPAILHMHGGGFVMRDAKSALHQVQQLAADLDCVVIAVDYRLAPETPFPGALDDNYASLKWLYQNAAQLGVDPSRIAVLGDSAGGGHAAMLAIATRDRGEIPLAYQALIYPMLDDRTGSTRTPAAHVGKVIWSAQDNVFGWSSLLGVPAGSAEVPHGAVPARVENLSGLAPAFIGVGAVDLFVDENIDYARRLMAAGVPTELHVVPGAFHGFDGIETASIARQFRSTLIHALSLALHRDN